MLVFLVLFVQVFVLNYLSITTYVVPMVYMVLIVMLPIESSQWKMLGVALAIGVLMDITTGHMGLNTLVTLPIAYFRRPILYSFAGLSTMSKEEGIPTRRKLGVRFHRYAITLIVLHSVLFLLAERLSFVNFGWQMLRIVISTIVSLVLSYVIMILFMKRLSA